MTETLEKIACVNCGGTKLENTGPQIRCLTCALEYPVREGIPDMLLEKEASDRNTQININFYDQNAPLYDVEWNEYEDWQIELRQKFVNKVKLTADVPAILDLACGPGRDLSYFSSLGCQMTGADLSYGQLRIARKKVNAPLYRADMRKLPFQDGVFDALWCCVALLHVNRTKAGEALGQMYRVIKPGGTIFLSVLWGEGTMDDVRREFYNNVPEIYEFYNEDEFSEMVESQGFVIEEVCRREAFRGRETSEVTGGVKTYIDVFAHKPIATKI
jgi:ubiquinone/menaquinone biosynthesis C-methylase UbiE